MSDVSKTNSLIDRLQNRVESAHAKLNAWDERHSLRVPLDHGLLNTPLRTRNGKAGIDGLARQHRELTEALCRAEDRLRRARADAAAPAIREAKIVAHEAADLKAKYGGKTEVLWSLSGSWLSVIRWNKKSVTVRMAGEPDTIPHTQVGGAR